ncbi:MAG TPA: pirin family protein [Burkholderiaceae bacterium]|nr:pirin family protein [Burkholderiaceae bacterium]
MITLRRGPERGYVDFGWLRSYHSFSFGDYYDPRHIGFSSLRVINEDRVAPGSGFPTHGHRDMEILSYVLEGELAHQDSIGNGSVIRPGDVQRMSAGTGVRHSEYNHARDATTHFLQIWIVPERQGLAPSYEEKNFPAAEKRGRMRLVASPDGADGSVHIHQDARMYVALVDGEEQIEKQLDPARHAYVQVARGEVEVNGERLSAGDAAMLSGESRLALRHGKNAEVLTFDLA